MQSKRLGLLHEIVPDASVIGALADPTFPATPGEIRKLDQAARALGIKIYVVYASTDEEVDVAFATLVREHISALSVIGSPFYDIRRIKLVKMASKYKIPAIYTLKGYAKSGGLASYGVSLEDGYRLAGVYTARILKGKIPAELPVIEPTKFSFVINLKAAKALGITVPASLIVQADEVIE